MNTQLETTIQVFEHIIRLHKAGIVANFDKIEEEREDYLTAWRSENYELAEIELADWKIAELSYQMYRVFGIKPPNFSAAIAKNNRRLDWMEQNPDPTKTPVELWKAAKIALKEVEDGNNV